MASHARYHTYWHRKNTMHMKKLFLRPLMTHDGKVIREHLITSIEERAGEMLYRSVVYFPNVFTWQHFHASLFDLLAPDEVQDARNAYDVLSTVLRYQNRARVALLKSRSPLMQIELTREIQNADLAMLMQLTDTGFGMEVFEIETHTVLQSPNNRPMDLAGRPVYGSSRLQIQEVEMESDIITECDRLLSRATTTEQERGYAQQLVQHLTKQYGL